MQSFFNRHTKNHAHTVGTATKVFHWIGATLAILLLPLLLFTSFFMSLFILSAGFIGGIILHIILRFQKTQKAPFNATIIN